MELADLTWPRRTDRCTIRPARAEDADAVWHYWRTPELARWTSGTTGEADFRERYGDPEKRARRLLVEHDGRIVGDLLVVGGDGWAQHPVREAAGGVEAELGWGFDPAYGGRGLATEAVRELVDICLSPAPDGLGLRRVTASCFTANEPSWRLMDRVGLRREAHHVRDSLHAELGWLDGYSYALLAEEWPPRPR